MGKAKEIVHSWTQSRFLKGCISTIVEKCNRFVVKCDEDAENGVATNILDGAVDLTFDVFT